MLHNILSLIVSTLAGILGGTLLLRFWMQANSVAPPSAFAQFIFLLTNWLVKPLRRIVPGWRGYDWASLLAAYLIAFVALQIQFGWLPNVSIQSILLLACLRLVQWIMYGFMGLLLLEVIFSWVNPHAPLAPFVRVLNDPLLRPLRRVIPSLGGIDITVIIAFLLLQIGLQVAESFVASLI